MFKFKATTAVVAFLTLAQANAQQRAPIGVFQAPVVAAPNGEGNLNFRNEDVSKLISQNMQEYFAQRREDKVYFERAVNQLEATFNAFNKEIALDYQNRANQSVLGSSDTAGGVKLGIPLDDFILLSTKYEGAKSILANQLQSVEAVTSGALPSANIMVTSQATSVEIPAWRNIDTSKIVAYYRERIKVIDDQIASLKFKVLDRQGNLIDVVGFKLDAGAFQTLSIAEIAKRTAEVSDLRRNGVLVKLRAQQDELTKKCLMNVNAFIETMGTQNRYRVTKPEDVAVRANRYKAISEMYFSRSYLRYKYGQKLGTIGVEFTKRWFGVEDFLNSPQDFVKFGQLPIRSENQLMQVAENFRNSVDVTKKKSTGIPGTSELLGQIFQGNFAVLTSANSLNALLTKMQGYEALVQTSTMVLALMAADVEEELTLTSGAGHAALKDSFIKRYLSDADNKKETRRLICAYDPSANSACGSDDSIGNSATDAASAKGLFNAVSLSTGVALDQLEQADKLETQLNALKKMSSNVTGQKSQRGLDNLFKD